MKKYSRAWLGVLLMVLTGHAALGQPAERPRSVILFIADGMGVSHLSTTSTILERGGTRLALERMPVTGLLRTNAHGGVVTESAASATSLATGFKTTRRRVGMSADSTRLPTILEAAREAGYATGLITTTQLVDATPASFATHVLNRDFKPAIAEQMIASGVDVLVGGNGGIFTPELLSRARQNGYAVLEDSAALAGCPRTPLLAVFAKRPAYKDAYGPPLAVSTRKALALFEQEARPFFLVVEQEETDSGAHDHDLPRVLDGMRELDAAVQEALSLAERSGDVLVLLTADHDTAGFSETEDDFEIRWLTGGHTNQWVPLFAFGPGAMAFTGVHENTELPKIIARSLGLKGFPAPMVERSY